MKIISIRKKNKYQDYELTINDGRILIANIDLLVRFDLAKGSNVSESLIKEITKLQSFTECKRKAFIYCSYSRRTIKQTKTKLSSLGFNSDEIIETITVLEKMGLLNDYDFAKKFINYQIKAKQTSKLILIQKLLSKGINKELIYEVLANTYPDSSEFSFALAAAKTKLQQISKKPVEKKRNNVISHLKTKGFSYDIIKKVTNELGI